MRFNAQAARTIARYIYTPSLHLHTHTYKYIHIDMTWRSSRPLLEIDHRFFPRSLVLLCFDSGGELWFRATISGRLLPSRAVVAFVGRLILSTLEFAPRIREHLTHHHLPSSLLAAILLASSVSFW